MRGEGAEAAIPVGRRCPCRRSPASSQLPPTTSRSALFTGAVALRALRVGVLVGPAAAALVGSVAALAVLAPALGRATAADMAKAE